MRRLERRAARRRYVTAGFAFLGATLAAAAAGTAKAEPGAVVQTIPPPVSQSAPVPPLHLTDVQRGKIQDALKSEDTEVSFQLKSAAPSASFNPSIGAKIPPRLKPQALPISVAGQMPSLKRYAYLKFKHNVLIVNPMTRRIEDMFPEAQ
jgi:hypothetical protein